MIEARGEVFDIGYQHYEGIREGRSRARMALWIGGIRTALGLGRGTWAKVVPGLLFVAVVTPALVLGIVASVLGLDDADILEHAGYYQIVLIILLIFSAVIGPELLCPDRRDQVISLYMVRPLSMTDYVIGRWVAFLTVTLALVYIGQVVLFIGLTLAAVDPWDYVRDNWLDIPRFLAAGLIVALFTTTIPLAVSAFTTRRAYAAAFVIGLFLISLPVAAVLAPARKKIRSASVNPSPDRQPDGSPLLDLGQIPSHVNRHIFTEQSNENPIVVAASDLTPAVPAIWYVLMTAGPGFVLWWSYQRLAK